MKNKFQKLFQKVKSENRMYLSMLSFLTLTIVGMLFQSFTVASNIGGAKRVVEYDEQVRTIYSFGCDISNVEKTDLIQSRAKTENRHFKAEVLTNNEVVITNTMLDTPTGEFDFEHMVAKAVRTNSGIEMYDFNGRMIETYNPILREGVPRMEVTESELEFFGLFRAPELLSPEDINEITTQGKVYQSIGRDKYSISDSEMQVIVNTSDLSVEYIPNGEEKPFDSSITYFASIGEGKCIRGLNITKSTETLFSGQARTSTVTTTFKNHKITQDGRLIHGGGQY